MKNSHIKQFMTMIISIILFGGCTLFDLELQQPYEYDYSAGSSNQLQKSGWEFILSRTDLFSHFIAAVEYAEVNPSEFDAPGITIFPLTNQAIANNPATGTGNNRFPGGYWYKHPVNNIKPDNWTAYPKEQVRQLILNHIMRYAISYNELLKISSGAITFFPTKATNGHGYISLHMLTSSENPIGNEVVTLWVNDFPSHYIKDNPTPSTATSNTYSMHIFPRSSNLQTINGSYVHVMDYYLEFPIESDFLAIPIYGN